MSPLNSVPAERKVMYTVITEFAGIPLIKSSQNVALVAAFAGVLEVDSNHESIGEEKTDPDSAA